MNKNLFYDEKIEWNYDEMIFYENNWLSKKTKAIKIN